MKNQPLLTSFPSTVFATAKRKIQAAIQATRKQLITDSLSGYALLFEPVLESGFLRQIDETKRQRHFGTIPTFWAWLGQILELNAACTKAVSMVQSWNIAQGLPRPSSNTTAYCNAFHLPDDIQGTPQPREKSTPYISVAQGVLVMDLASLRSVEFSKRPGCHVSCFSVAITQLS